MPCSPWRLEEQGWRDVSVSHKVTNWRLRYWLLKESHLVLQVGGWVQGLTTPSVKPNLLQKHGQVEVPFTSWKMMEFLWVKNACSSTAQAWTDTLKLRWAFDFLRKWQGRTTQRRSRNQDEQNGTEDFRGWEAQGMRIIMASFSTRNRMVNMNVVQVHASTNEATDEDKDDFYNSLKSVIDKLPKKDVNIIMGDLNGKVSEDNSHCEQGMGKHGIGQANNNGERLMVLYPSTRWSLVEWYFRHRIT